MKYRVIKRDSDGRYLLQVGAGQIVTWNKYTIRGWLDDKSGWAISHVFDSLEDARRFLEINDPGPPRAVQDGGLEWKIKL